MNRVKAKRPGAVPVAGEEVVAGVVKAVVRRVGTNPVKIALQARKIRQ